MLAYHPEEITELHLSLGKENEEEITGLAKPVTIFHISRGQKRMLTFQKL